MTDGGEKQLYDVALSYASEDRDFIEMVAEYLEEHHIRVFYDKNAELELWGKNLYDVLDEIYRVQSKYVVMFISKHYAQKVWTNHERQSALSRALYEKREYILPARFDDTELKGLLPTIAYIPLTQETPASFAEKIIKKIKGPHIELIFPMTLLQKTCTHQVNIEIQRRVGRKYLPDLCHPRPIENDIVNFISADLQTIQLRELGEELNKLKPLHLHPSAAEWWSGTIEAIGHAQIWHDTEPHLHKLLDLVDDKKREGIKQAIDGVMCLRRNCFLVKDKAGSGKTNLLCRLATHYKQSKTLAIFLSCKFDLPKSRSLAEVIVGSLYAALEHLRTEGEHIPALAGSQQDIINAIGLTLQKERAQLVVFLDGINENRDLGAMDEAITDLLANWNSLPIKFIITCRDIFWSFFSETHWNRFLFDKKAYDLPEFEEEQIDRLIKAYFQSFGITGRLIGIAREKCRHPLILRFFCEAYRDQHIKDFEDLRLKDLFEIYWKRKQQEIAESLGMGSDGGWRVESFLFNIVDYMSNRYATQLLLNDVPQITGEHDLESDRSIYKHLLDQDIILEELPPDNAFDRSYAARRISFVYDEFYDYMMAWAHVRKNNWDSKDSRELCLDLIRLIRRSADFEQLRGVIEYLVLLSEPKNLNRLLCAILARLGKYEILCNVLPKLRGETDWIEEVLRKCLVTFAASKSSRTTKKATGWQPEYDTVEQLINETDSEYIYRVLLQRE